MSWIVPPVSCSDGQGHGTRRGLSVGVGLILAITCTAVESPRTMVADAQWRPLATGDLLVKAGTALDLSRFVGADPAGSHGRVIATPDGHLAFADRPSAPVRFTGAVMLPEMELADLPLERIPDLAEAVRRQGYSLVRTHFLDNFLTPGPAPADWPPGKPFLDPGRLDRFDRLRSELKRRGIYLYLDAMTHVSGYTPGYAWTPEAMGLEFKKRIWTDPVVRRHWIDGVTALLTHRNPYTGTTLAEDPQLAVVLPFNEQEHNLFGWGIPAGLRPGWQQFLERKYRTIPALVTAWGKKPGVENFAAMPLFTTAEIWDRGELGRDIAMFLAEGETELLGFFRDNLRKLGYRGLITHFDYMQSRRYALARTQVEVVSMHAYHAHPSEGHQPGSMISQGSSFADGLNWWREIIGVRLAGQPFLITEANQVYWNRYRHEEGLVTGGYAAFQDLDGLMAYGWNVTLSGRPIQPFYIGVDPIARANQVVATLLFQERRIRPALHRIHFILTQADILAKSEVALDGDHSRLGLLTGMALAVEGGRTRPPADLEMIGGDGAPVLAGKLSVTTQDQTSGGLPGAIALLRQRGILSGTNPTDPAAGRFASDTGEILAETKAERFTVRGRGVAGIAVKTLESPVDVGPWRLERCDGPAAITVAALTGGEIANANRFLVVVATDARNSGEVYDDQAGTRLRKLGTLPVLVHTLTATVSLARAPGAPLLKAYPLALDGTRRTAIPVQRVDGRLVLEVASATWPEGPTPFIELVASP